MPTRRAFRLAIVALCLTGAGMMLTILGWHDIRADEVLRTRGVETIAKITGGVVHEERDGKKSYTIVVSWIDKSGRLRTSQPLHVSNAFTNQISSDGKNIAVRYTRIRYAEDEPNVAPIILGDREDHEHRIATAWYSGPILLLLGLILSWFVWRDWIRAPSH